MKNLSKGLIAGAAATLVMSALMIMKGLMGVMPELNPIAMLSGMASDMTGMTLGPAFGWAMHFMIGTVIWGGLFTIVQARVPGSPIKAGFIGRILRLVDLRIMKNLLQTDHLRSWALLRRC